MLYREVGGSSAAPAAKYLLALAMVTVLALGAKNLVRGRFGRSWMAMRDIVDSGARCNRSMKTGFARLCQAL